MTKPGVLLIDALDLAAMIIGITVRYPSLLSLAVVAVALITFFGLLALDVPFGNKGRDAEPSLRRAIAITIVTVYLVLISVVVLFQDSWPSSEATKTLLASFTATVGVVVAFFFGASAYVQGRGPTGSS